jgi:hypothetical protein
MKPTAIIATISYVVLVITVVGGTIAKQQYGEGPWLDPLGILGFILFLVFLGASGIAAPIIYTNRVYQSSQAPPTDQSVFTWILGISLLAMNLPATFLKGDTKAPLTLAYSLNIFLSLIASFLFAVFSILIILMTTNLLK